MSQYFILEKEGRIATLTFNRPEKRNPLNEEIVCEQELIIGCRRYKVAGLMTLGLVNQLVKRAELLSAVRTLAENLASKNPNAVTVAKATITALILGNSVVRPDLLLSRE